MTVYERTFDGYSTICSTKIARLFDCTGVRFAGYWTESEGLITPCLLDITAGQRFSRWIIDRSPNEFAAHNRR